MTRTHSVVGSGLAAGLLLGLLGPVVFLAACVWDGRTSWSALSDADFLPYWAAFAAAGAANGGIGAWAGSRGRRRVAPVAYAPLLMLIYPASSCVRDPSDSKSWGGVLFVFVLVGVFVWVAGRTGQSIGLRWGPPR